MVGSICLCRVWKGTGSQVDVILKKEARAVVVFIGVCEAAVEASRLMGIRGTEYSCPVCTLDGVCTLRF